MSDAGLETMIEIEDLSFRYPGGMPILEDFDLVIREGEAWTILGPSGCGKTTLLYLLAGLRQPTSGSIKVRGQELSRPRPRTGLILQDFGLMPWATVRENASLGLNVRGFYGPDGTHAPRDEVPERTNERVDYWLDWLGLSSVASMYPGQISGGQRQRTAIARTLALNPDLLLMDEPFAALDAPTRESLQDLTMRLQDERGLTTVLVTHTIEEAALMGEKVLILGEIPNREALVVENPGASQHDFRDSHAYQDMIRQLRERLEAVT